MQAETIEEKNIVTDTFEITASRITEVIHIALGEPVISNCPDVTPQRILEIYNWKLLNYDGYRARNGELTIEEVYSILEKTFYLWKYNRDPNGECPYSTILSFRTQ